MAARRRYTWIWQPVTGAFGPAADEGAAAAQGFLDRICEDEGQFYSDPEISGTAFGFVEIHLTVSAKDQWKIPWRVRNRLLPHLALAMGVRPVDLERRGAVKLPPHQHPNRASRWRPN